ncbi:GNAT family N-acetyltransferase [Streptomyces sp. NPDC049949]|uniref:GNAT family N-acetyltransferase n=1 Tax=Streptomyces sp. NPDC049949 TaxID=3154627 RepID=UPI003414873C
MVKRRPGTTPTLEEVAALAGVGRGTVSRVINNATGVKASTRRAVQQAIAELGYVPNLAARSRAGRDDWFARVLVPQYETWVAVTGSSVVGLMVLNGQELNQLSLDPAWRGRGLGDRFMALAKKRQPDGLAWWTFQVNESAHRFYERHGFIAVKRTDGVRNDEREPDVRYVWPPPPTR